MKESYDMTTAKQVLIAVLLLCLLAPILRLFGGNAFAEEPGYFISVEADQAGRDSVPADIAPDPTQEAIPTEPILTEEPAPTIVPDPTQEPIPPESPYKVTFGIPKGWINADATNIKIRVADKQNLGWRKVEVKIKGNDWLDVSEKFIEVQDDKIDMEVSDNSRLIVRVTDPSGNEYKEEADIACFDRSAPTVTAGINDLLLHVEALDKQSGVAGIQVNGLLFTTLENGILNVRIEEVLIQYEKLAVRAFDYAGNFSEAVMLDNPYFIAPLPEATPTLAPTATPEPTATPKPTKKPSKGSGDSATSMPTATASPVILPTTDPAAQVTATPAPITTTEYITLGPGMPFKAKGNMNTLDMLYSAHTNKQFITVQTRNGETFFLVIDYDRPIDADAELYETYFLNLVDERDLLALVSQDELPTPTPVVIVATPEPTAVPMATNQPAEPVKGADNGMMLIALVAVIALVGGGLYMFMQQKKGKGRKKPIMDDYEFDEEEEEDESAEHVE